MENEKTGGVRAAEHRPLCLCILAIGALFAWWNLYHDDGFLFLSNYLNQVESCLACYGGALGAFALIVGARASWRRRERPWLIALAIAQALTGTWLFIAVMADWPAGVIGGQLFIGTAFFSQLFFLMRWLCTRPVPHIAVAIAVAIATYGVLEAAAWAVMALFPPHASAHCRALPPSGIVHRLQLASSLETPRFGPKWPRSLSLCLCRDR